MPELVELPMHIVQQIKTLSVKDLEQRLFDHDDDPPEMVAKMIEDGQEGVRQYEEGNNPMMDQNEFLPRARADGMVG